MARSCKRCAADSGRLHSEQLQMPCRARANREWICADAAGHHFERFQRCRTGRAFLSTVTRSRGDRPGCERMSTSQWLGRCFLPARDFFAPSVRAVRLDNFTNHSELQRLLRRDHFSRQNERQGLWVNRSSAAIASSRPRPAIIQPSFRRYDFGGAVGRGNPVIAREGNLVTAAKSARPWMAATVGIFNPAIR